MTKIPSKTQKHFILLLNMYYRDLLCYFNNILNFNKFNIQKSDFFPHKKIPAQHARYLLCVVHKVHIAQNIIFKGIVLLQIYIPLHKQIKTQLLPLFVFQNHPSKTLISIKIGLRSKKFKNQNQHF